MIEAGDCYLCDSDFVIVIIGSISMVVILVHDNYSAALQSCRSSAMCTIVRSTYNSIRDLSIWLTNGGYKVTAFLQR
jgi:hypothetical protein